MKPLTWLKKELRARFVKWLDPDTWLPRSGGYYGTESGVMVSAETAMRVSAVFACVRILSWTIASLPLPIYRRLQPRGKERATEHQLYRLLHDEPNPEQTSFQFRALVMVHAALWGNGYAEIEYDVQGKIVALWPLPPWRVKVQRTKDIEALYYELTLLDGTKKSIPAYAMFHISGVGTDGREGLTVIGVARQSIGLALAAEEFGARFFGGGANMGGVAEAPGKLDDKTYKRLKDSLEEKYTGLGNAHRILLLEEGLKYTRVGIPPNDAQFLETRKFQITDIARIFGIPSYLINDTERTTSWGTGIEQMGIGLVVYTLRPWCVNWEQEIQRKLLLGSPEYFAEFLVDGLLRGDIASRYAAYAIGRQWGWLSADDVCELENRNPLPQGQGNVYLNPLNMISAASYLKPVALPNPSEPAKPALADLSGAAFGDRMRIVGGFRFVLMDAAQRILKREEADVVRQARKVSGQPFDAWLTRFYQEHADYMSRQLMPVLQGINEVAGGALDLPAFIEAHSAARLTELRGAIVEAAGKQSIVADTLQGLFASTLDERASAMVASILQSTGATP